MSEGKSNNGEIILGLLGIVFVTLKLCGVISWSWWWVTSPFWGVIPLALIGIILALMVDAKNQKSKKRNQEILNSWGKKNRSSFQNKLQDALEKQRNKNN